MKEKLNLSAPIRLLTRRDAMRASSAVATIAALSGFTFARSVMAARADDEVTRTAEAIHQETVLKASRKLVYEALTETEQFNKVTQLSAAVQSGMALGSSSTKISGEQGGTFTLFGGHILGRHVELIPNERIVQAWRTSDWAAGIYSIARFALAEENGGTRLVFDHTGFPNGQAEHLAAGWKANYWEPLAKFLAM